MAIRKNYYSFINLRKNVVTHWNNWKHRLCLNTCKEDIWLKHNQPMDPRSTDWENVILHQKFFLDVILHFIRLAPSVDMFIFCYLDTKGIKKFVLVVFSKRGFFKLSFATLTCWVFFQQHFKLRWNNLFHGKETP